MERGVKVGPEGIGLEPKERKRQKSDHDFSCPRGKRRWEKGALHDFDQEKTGKR